MNVARAISPPAKFCALFLTADIAMVDGRLNRTRDAQRRRALRVVTTSA
jgi:hypothetical protein